ncbi:MAG: hypothetical protein WAX77_04900 [Methylococcaceae bacterium]
MKRSDAARQTFNIIPANELTKKAAIHEAGHAAAIYLGNKRKQLPPVFFQICMDNAIIEANTFYDKYPARIEGGRLIHTLPCSIEEATSNFSPTQKHAYQQAFEADIINLLAGSLAEAHYVALRDNELINPRLVSFNTLHNYGGFFDLSIIQDYLACFSDNVIQREAKIKELFLAAFHFVSDYANWKAITTLATYILAQSKSVIDCEEVITVLDTTLQRLTLHEVI